MELNELQSNWDEFGKRDPLWAILSYPEKRNGKWDVRKFFESGEREIAGVLEYVGSLGLSLSRSRALDFGCGVGRLTQALCQHFDECCGVDIAPSMIKLAEEYNGHADRCRYYINQSGNLRLFEDDTFDFIYSNSVFQHMKPEYSKRYIKEFLRVLVPGGVLLFQIPSEPEPVGKALPDSAFKARISPHESLITAEPGAQTTIRVTVKNISDVTWRSLGATSNVDYQIKLGNHWLDNTGKLLAYGVGRANLPKDLEPMEEVDLYLDIDTPPHLGDYILELDMVQERVAWFKDKGSETARVRARIKGPDLYHAISNLYPKPTNIDPPSGRSELLVPKMEMHGIPKEEVLDLLVNCGGKIIHVKEEADSLYFRDWLSFFYCVTKAPLASQS